MNIIKCVSEWYKENCDGEWEHQYGVYIGTLDNPGWEVRIDLSFTRFENLEIEYKLFQENENDWYGFSVKNKVFSGTGDADKLLVLLNEFINIVGVRSEGVLE